jgi:hypothetical protein
MKMTQNFFKNLIEFQAMTKYKQLSILEFTSMKPTL